MEPDRPFVFDASRLVWRLWRGRLPTGIDRVCLAYLEEFAACSLAMLQWRGQRIVLGPRDSDALFAALLSGAARPDRMRLAWAIARALPASCIRRADFAGRIYLNVGHTGLNARGLTDWLARHRLKPVYLIHDLIPITHPAYCRAGEAERHAGRIRNALRSARGLIVNSAATGAELAQFAQGGGLPVPDILVAHLGIEDLPAAIGAAPWPRPYFLSIGTIEARKNHILLLRLWERLREELRSETPDLVLIGQRGWEADETFALLDEGRHEFGRVLELDRCSDAELAAWIDHARAVLMPSHAEGYGLPVMEAMSRGMPVIASDLPVYREVAQDIPLFLDPDDGNAWLRAVRRYLADSPEREEQRRRLATYRPPSWQEHLARAREWLVTL